MGISAPLNINSVLRVEKPKPFELSLPYDDYKFSARLYELVHDWGIPTETEVAFLAKYLPRPGVCVLDLGCGGGRHALGLAAMGYMVTGIDIGPYPIELGRRLALEKKIPAEFRCENFLSINYRNEFNLAFLICGQMGHCSPLEHRIVFAHAYRALKDGGVFIVHSNRFKNEDRIDSSLWYQEKHPLYFEHAALVHRQQYYFPEERVKVLRDFAIDTVTQENRLFGISEQDYQLDEIIMSGEREGFCFRDAFGSYTSEPFERSSVQTIVVFAK